MTKNINYEETAGQFLDALPRGAFLSVKSGDKINTMTIGWGSIGYAWKKPVIMVMVRYSRYTYDLIKDASDFTVSIPLDSDFKSPLAISGSKSGRDINKFEECKLTADNAQTVSSPVIGECGLVYECKILYRQPMTAEGLDPEIAEKMYADDNWHVLYFGEITACYNNKQQKQ